MIGPTIQIRKRERAPAPMRGFSDERDELRSIELRHYTPKHGSWLDMAKSELAVLSTQCLDRRISDKTDLVAEVAAWQKRRNTLHAKADWQFKTADPRVKLASLYPQFV